MKAHYAFLVLLGCCVFIILLCCILPGCDSPKEEPGEFQMLMVGVASYPVTGAINGYDTVKDGLMKHVYAAPGTTCLDFEAAIEKIEKIRSVPEEFGRSPNFTADHSYLFRYEGRKAVYYGRFVQVTNNPSESVLTFSAGEITNLTYFVAKLKTHSDPVSAFLMSRFSESDRLAIARFPESGMDEKTLEPILINELNAIVLGPSIYDEDRFRGVTLRPAALQLLRLGLHPRPGLQMSPQQMLAASNRMLLEDAYPSNLPMKRENEMRYFVAIKY